MTRNPTISKVQEAVVRDFIFEAEAVGLDLGPEIWTVFLSWLDYKLLPNGALVWTETEVRIPFGSDFSAYPDQYGPDGEEFNGDNSKDTVNASASESPVREFSASSVIT